MKLRSRITRIEVAAVSAVAIAGVALATGTANAAASAPAPIKLTSSQCPADISYGQHSGCVTELQQLLNQHGAHLAVDGDFGPATLAAVKSYQSSHGLSVDGIVGPNTKASLDGGSTPPPPTGGGQSKIVSFAQAIEAGKAEKGWSGGRVPYGWAGGHTATPGPSPADCGAAGGDPACWTATANHTLGHNGQISVDCSGFVRWVYALAYGRDVLGSDATYGQIRETHRVSSPVPGDLVFFGSGASNPDHVGIYIGGGKMIDALETGRYIETDPLSAGGHLIGYYRF